jgi:hypothetical protein
MWGLRLSKARENLYRQSGIVLLSCECIGVPELRLNHRTNGVAYNNAAVI